MLWLSCPRCGRRPIDEFTFGGERRPVPDSITDPDERDFDEVWVFENPDGPTTERWFHAVRLPALADGPPRHLDRHGRRDRPVTRLADRQIEIVLRNRVQFGVGAIERLPEVVAAAGGSRVFVVTDPGVRGSGVIDRVLGVLAAAGVETAVFAEVEPNPGASTVERGAAALRAFGLAGTVVVPVGGGSSMDTAKALDLRAANDLAVWDLEYDGPRPGPGRPVVAVPTTAGTGAETNSFAVITDEAAGRKGYIGHPSLLPVATILDPALTVGLPPAATAATGIDAMTHSLESLLSANPNPFAEAMALGVIRTIGTWLRRGRRRRLGPRGALADADGLAPRRASARRAGPASGWSTRWAIRSGRAARSPTGRRWPPSCPRSFASTSARATASWRSSASRSASRRAPNRSRRPLPSPIGAIDKLLRDVDQRPTLRRLGLADDAAIDQLVTDTLDDAAIRNSPRLPTASEARAILEVGRPAELDGDRAAAGDRPASRPAAARPRR